MGQRIGRPGGPARRASGFSATSGGPRRSLPPLRFSCRLRLSFPWQTSSGPRRVRPTSRWSPTPGRLPGPTSSRRMPPSPRFSTRSCSAWASSGCLPWRSVSCFPPSPWSMRRGRLCSTPRRASFLLAASSLGPVRPACRSSKASSLMWCLPILRPLSGPMHLLRVPISALRCPIPCRARAILAILSPTTPRQAPRSLRSPASGSTSSPSRRRKTSRTPPTRSSVRGWRTAGER